MEADGTRRDAFPSGPPARNSVFIPPHNHLCVPASNLAKGSLSPTAGPFSLQRSFALSRMFGDRTFALRTLGSVSEDCWDVNTLVADWQRYGLCITSLISNFWVLTHHLTEQPHPEFLIHRRRRISVHTHFICGTGEMFFAMLAFGTCRLLFFWVACVFCFGHVRTSYYLMTGLFGIRSIMTPAYGPVGQALGACLEVQHGRWNLHKQDSQGKT